MKLRRITLLCGHYGGGKTNIAVNFAMEAKKTCEKVTIPQPGKAGEDELRAV